MRDARGQQHETKLEVPALDVGQAKRAWAVATSNDEQFNIVVYYGYPQPDLEKNEQVEKINLRIQSAIPEQVKGRTLVISRADAREIVDADPTLAGHPALARAIADQVDEERAEFLDRA